MLTRLSGARRRVLAMAVIVGVAVSAECGADRAAHASGGISADALTETRSTRTVPIDDATIADPPPPPPPGGSTVSFLATSPTDTISPDLHAHTFSESCPDGWYVRPAQPDAAVPTSMNAAYIEHKSSAWISSEGQSISEPYQPGNDWSVFQAFTAKFTNVSADHSHSVYIQWWCDKVPSWYPASPTSAAAKAIPSAPTQAAATKSPTPVGGVGPVTYSCYYCSFGGMTVTNLGSGLSLDWSNAASGAPLLIQPPSGNQQWYLAGGNGGSNFQYGIVTMGVWREAGAPLDWAIAEDPSTGQVSFTNGSSGVPPSYGDWYYVNQGAGLAYNVTCLVNTQTGDCLTATEGAGSQVTGAPCDATNKAQWWVTSQPSS